MCGGAHFQVKLPHSIIDRNRLPEEDGPKKSQDHAGRSISKQPSHPRPLLYVNEPKFRY